MTHALFFKYLTYKMWFQAIFGFETLSTFKRVKIIDHNELDNFLFGKEQKAKN